MNYIGFLSKLDKKRMTLLFWFGLLLFFQSYAQNDERPCEIIVTKITPLLDKLSTPCVAKLSESSSVIVSNYDGRKDDGYYKKEWIFIRSGKTSFNSLKGPLDWLYDSQLSIGDDRVLLRRKLEFSKPRPGLKSGGQYIVNTKIINKKLPYGLSLFGGHKEGIRMTSDYISLQNSDATSQLAVKKDEVGISGALYLNTNENDLDSTASSIYITNTRNTKNYSDVSGLSVYKGDQEKIRIENERMYFFSNIDISGKKLFADTLFTKIISLNGLSIGKKLKIGENIDFTSNTEQVIRVAKGITHRMNNKENAGFSIENSLGKILHVTLRGRVGIGTSTPEQKLEVRGTIRAKSFIADAAEFPDYVFEKGYDLMNIDQVKKYVRKHKHLPGMPSQKEVMKKGLDIKKISLLNVEKLEELYLHLFELDKKTNQVFKKIDQMDSKLNKYQTN